MSPRYLGGNYRSRFHPRSRKCACQFLRETERVNSKGARAASSASRGDNEVDHAVCLKKNNFRCTLSFPIKMASSTQLWYIRASAGRYFFRWDRLLDEGLAFVQAGVPSCPDDVTPRPCANFKCNVADVNKEINTDFRGVKCVSGECYQPFRENSSWYIRSDCLAQEIFNQSFPAAHFQQFTGSWYRLWITGNSLWHRDYPGHAVDWCQLYLQGNYIFYLLIINSLN